MTATRSAAPVLGVLLLVPAAPLASADGSPPGRPDYRELDAVVAAELGAAATPGAAIAIVRGDEVVYAKGFGVASAETQAPVTPDMLFRIGSITKVLTAAAFVTAAREKGMPLDAPLGERARGLAPRLRDVTPRQLLSHSAGMADHARTCCAREDSGLAAQVRGYDDATYFVAPPGRIFSYSNPGYTVAGYLLETLAGLSYADAVHARVLAPLGMTRTTFRPTVAMTFPLAQGHDVAPGGPTVVRPFVENVGDWPAGFAYSTATDLARFAIAFMNGGRLGGRQVLHPSVIDTVATPYVEVPFSWDVPPGYIEGASYGHGLFVQDHRGVRLLHHGGTINGFGAFLAMAPEHRFALVLLANRTGSLLPRAIDTALEMSLPLRPRRARPPAPAQDLTRQEAERYAGVYVNGRLRIELSVEDGVLFRSDSSPASAEEGAGPAFKVPVTKVGPGRLAFTPPGETVPSEFLVIPGAGGGIEYLHTSLGAARRLGGPGAARRAPHPGMD